MADPAEAPVSSKDPYFFARIGRYFSLIPTGANAEAGNAGDSAKAGNCCELRFPKKNRNGTSFSFPKCKDALRILNKMTSIRRPPL